MKKLTVPLFKKMKNNSKLSLITVYDYSSAKIVNKSNIDAILVGDSLGMVIKGEENTLNVEISDIIYHTKAVANGAPDKLIISDMPFLTYIDEKSALENAGSILKYGKADAVKIEGCHEKIIKKLVEYGIPVMGHIGLTPQSVKEFGGFKLQGKDKNIADKLFEEAKKIEEAGAFSLVLEMIPAELGEKITKNLSIPTIGIGAGCKTDGQVLVYHDLLGYNLEFNPKFVRKYLDFYNLSLNAINQYVDDVKNEKFPSEKESF